MHFAIPNKGSSRSSPFLTNPVSRNYRVLRRPILALLLIVGVLYWFMLSFSNDGRPPDAPHTVLVMVLNRTAHPQAYLDKIVQNRKDYARAHGYGVFIKDSTEYPIGNVAGGWARAPAIRHAMTEFKYSEYFWYLDQTALIMNTALTIEDHITKPERLETLMRRDVSVVPPESIIKTYRHVPADRIQFILVQDKEGLQPSSMVFKSGDWAKYVLDAWYDPIFRFYNFQKAERHALEHVVQWHPTILAKLALVPQGIMNSYSTYTSGEGAYKPGDFVVNFHDCERTVHGCEQELDKYWAKRIQSP